MTPAPSPMARYVNVVDPINADFAELRTQLKHKNLRIFCLLDFETTLSFMLDKPISEFEAYKEIRERVPLDKLNPFSTLEYNTFRWVISQYEQIMREAKLIGNWKKKEKIGYAANYFSEEDDV